MYEYLEGKLVRHLATRIVLDVGGVGYDVCVAVGSAFPVDDAGQTCVWTHFAVREDAQTLYGFPDSGARRIFRLLLKVRGVGPGLALGIVSSLPGVKLLEAVANEDLSALLAVKGVGRKTGEQILLDLREKAQATLADWDGADVLTPQAAPPRSQVLEDAVVALASIGYSAKEARKSVERAAQKVDPEDLELLVRTALHG